MPPVAASSSVAIGVAVGVGEPLTDTSTGCISGSGIYEEQRFVVYLKMRCLYIHFASCSQDHQMVPLGKMINLSHY